MSLALTKTRSLLGIQAKSVSVEVHLSNGLPAFNLVGLPETVVKESKDRVRSAIINSQFEFPCRRITVNLAPADLPKSGCGFDLPIALGILAASAQIPAIRLQDHEFIGELALDGSLRRIPAIIPAILAARQAQQYLICSTHNADEAQVTSYENVFFANNLREVCSYLCRKTSLQTIDPTLKPQAPIHMVDWSDIKGQIYAKQAMVIAACGGHSILLYGPPGTGKTMLAKRFHTILPNLSEEQALETAAIHSLHGRTPNFNSWLLPPFRAPHHTASPVALVGGGNPPKPGEISLAHNGVLFLDELPEFSRQVLETLREPLESGEICISRANIQTEFPAKFQLIAAMNPCPCGQWGNTQNICICSPERINRYLGKLSGPLLDRIDLQVNLTPLSQAELVKSNLSNANASQQIQLQISAARKIQFERQGRLNAHLEPRETEQMCILGSAEEAFLIQVLQKLKLSARAYHRLLKVARTIADLNQIESVKLNTLHQALSFKQALHTPS